MIFIVSISFIGCAFTQTDKIKQKVWHDIGEGPRRAVEGNWWSGTIELVDANIDLNNPGFKIYYLEEFKKALSEKQLYVLTWNGNKKNGNLGTQKVFADNDGNILGYDYSHIPDIPGRDK